MSYYVALMVPNDVQGQFVNQTASLIEHFQTIHPIPMDQHYLILASLGELTEAQRIQTNEILTNIKGYRMRLETTAPALLANGSLVQKLKKASRLDTLQKHIIHSFEKTDIPMAKNSFYPYITLAEKCTCTQFHPRIWLQDKQKIEISITTMTLLHYQSGVVRQVEEYPLAQESPQYVYILKCGDGSYYTGWTNHLEARIKAHQNGRGAKYTKSHQPVELVYYEEYEDKQTAMRREYACKQMSRAQKEELFCKTHQCNEYACSFESTKEENRKIAHKQ